MKTVYYMPLESEGRKELTIFRDLIAESNSATNEQGKSTCDITDLVTKSLSRLKLTHLTIFGSLKLDLTDKRLVSLVKQSKSLVSLEIKYNDLDNQDAKNIASLISDNYCLTVLSLQGNLITSSGFCAISKALSSNSCLKSIDVSFNSISNYGVRRFAEALKYNSTVEYINLSSNQINEHGIKCLAAMLKVNKSVEVLELGFNKIGDKGAIYIANALSVNRTLKKIAIQEAEINPVGEGVKALEKSLYLNFKLIALDLYYHAYAEQWQNKHTEYIEIYLEQNMYILGESAEDIQDLLSTEPWPNLYV